MTVLLKVLIYDLLRIPFHRLFLSPCFLGLADVLCMNERGRENGAGKEGGRIK